MVLTEEPAEDYETQWELEDTVSPGRTAQTGPLVDPVRICYTNTREVLIDTGVQMETGPYLLMTVVGTAPLLRRRRKRE